MEVCGGMDEAVTNEESNPADRAAHWRELVAVVLLSTTALLTAWSGFQSHKWGGVMAISFSEASTARIEASRADGVANRMQAVQVALFAQWV